MTNPSPSSLTRGLDALREGRCFEAHEDFEALWHASVGAPRTLAKVLVQIAAAFEKLSRGEPQGLRKNLEKARLNLEPLARSSRNVLGIDCSRLEAALEADLGRAEALASFLGSATHAALEEAAPAHYDRSP